MVGPPNKDKDKDKMGMRWKNIKGMPQKLRTPEASGQSSRICLNVDGLVGGEHHWFRRVRCARGVSPRVEELILGDPEEVGNRMARTAFWMNEKHLIIMPTSQSMTSNVFHKRFGQDLTEMAH